MERRQLDAVVVGAGSAGAAAAWQLARRGLKVALLDRRPADGCGARWVNGIPAWMFDAARVPRPEPPELRDDKGGFLLLGKGERRRLLLPGSPLPSVDMPRLTERLQGLAVEEGVSFHDQTSLQEVELDGERPVAVRCLDRGVDGRQLELRADLFVDATGLRGALRERVPALAAHCPRVPRAHTIEAVHQTCEVENLAGAESFVTHLGIRPGDGVSWVGVAAGLSTVAVRTNPTLTEVELLTGVGGLDPVTTAQQLMLDLTRRETWIGERLFGGSGLIPVRRPYDQLGAAGVALVGNAACQVFPAHGSGVGIGLIAGQLLAQAANSHGDPGSAAAIWDYQARFHRQHGALLGAYDVFRRLSNRLSGDDVDAMLAAGFIDPGSSLAAIDQRMPPMGMGLIGRTLLASLRAPRQATQMAPVLARMQRVHRAYRDHPRRPDGDALRRWSHRLAALFDERPDIP
jgi:menaquinone-9 beta-reductase